MNQPQPGEATTKHACDNSQQQQAKQQRQPPTTRRAVTTNECKQKARGRKQKEGRQQAPVYQKPPNSHRQIVPQNRTMSLFVDFRIASKAPNSQTLRMQWCKVDQILAVATDDNTVNFYQEEGDRVADAEVKRNCAASALDWRPTQKVLASGWEDGTLSLWNVKDKSEKADRSVHSHPIDVLAWSPEGGRLIAGDRHGLASVWRTDHRSRLAMVCKFQLISEEGYVEPVTTCRWIITPEYRDAQTDLPTPPQHFLVGTESGTVSLLDLKGQLEAKVHETSSIVALHWYEERQRVVVITKECAMAIYSVETSSTANAALSLVSRVKLSMSASAVKEGISGSNWIAPGLLVTSGLENVVRFWDVEHDENYMVSLSSMQEGDAAPRRECVSTIAYNVRTKVLAVGTQTGKCLLWRFVGDSGMPSSLVVPSLENGAKEMRKSGHGGGGEDYQQIVPLDSNATNAPNNISDGQRSASSQKDWESESVTTCGTDQVQNLTWGPGESIFAASTTSATSVFCRAVLHRKLRQDVAAVQVSAKRVLVRRGASIQLDLFVGIRIKGLDINDTNMVVWNRKMAEVYEFKGDSISIVVSFPTKAHSMCLHQGQTIFQAVGSKLNVCNLQGVPTKSVSFTEQEGNPVLLDVNGKFLVVATSRGLIKLFDISRREPRQITSGKRFARKNSKKLIGEIRSVRVNVDGTRVSILCDRNHSSVLAEPDSNLYVWYPDKDEIKSYDFGPLRYPTSHFWDNGEARLLACEAMRTGRQHSGSNSNGVLGASGGGEGTSSINISDIDPFADVDEETKRNSENIASHDNSESKVNGDNNRSSQNGKLARQASTRGVPTKRTATTSNPVQVFTLFATNIPEKGVMLQDSFPLDKGMDALLGLRVPRLFFITKSNADENHGLPKLKGRTMRDFVGLDARLDDETKRALINFSYYLTIGNMDEAYKAVKLIQNVAVWENMAHMCVKTKRLDVAEVCLGNMGHARGARALREAKSEPELEAQVAMVAIQLGLLDDAERLYLECGRHDLLNKMLQASGQWEKALEVASQYDRIHLRDTHFKYARYLESLQDGLAAVRNYEASDSHREQVPRMLFQEGRIDEVESYVQSCGDEKVTRWWGQYCESQGEYERALHLYRESSDELSMVRVHCFMDNTAAAADVALNSSTPAVSFLLARHCEQKGEIKEAMQFFSRAGRYNHAVRLARENEFDSELVNLALRAKPNIMVEAARYLEAKGLNDSAVMLYQKGGNIPRALDLCFRAQLFDMLRSIADSLDSGTMPDAQSSPEILSRCAEFFIEHGQFDKAVHLLVTGKEYERALDLCMAHKVVITDDMAERMTLEKLPAAGGSSTAAKRKKQSSSGPGGDGGDSEAKAADQPVTTVSAAKAKAHEARRLELLLRLAKCCKKQGSFQLATKKYTQAGERNKAMKCLLKSGDTDKIIFFAGVSKRAEIYILAANYLQNLDWHNNPNIMKHIMTFYTKAKAYVQLSNFYDACSQVEMDEYRDYDKALGALKEAAKYLKKASSATGDRDNDFAMDTLNTRISLVERFVHARTRVGSDAQEAERICDSLLSNPNLDEAVRAGDVYAMVIEITYRQQNDAAKAFSYMQRMRAQGIALGPYLSDGLVGGILKDQGMAEDVSAYIEDSDAGATVHDKYTRGGDGGRGGDDVVSDDGIEEDIEEEDDDDQPYK